MKVFLVRFVQWHESFRIAELEALAVLAGVNLEVLEYNSEVSFDVCPLRMALLY